MAVNYTAIRKVASLGSRTALSAFSAMVHMRAPKMVSVHFTEPVEADARIRNQRGPSLERQYAHRLWHEGHLTQAEVAQEIQRLSHVPFAQSQVSRATKLVDDWLQSIKADSPASRARRSLTVGPSRNEPSVPETGKHLTRKEVDDQDN